MPSLVVREHARLTTDTVVASLDRATIPQSARDWLIERSYGSGATQAPLVKVDGPRSIRVLNYVGVIETPCGTRLELLPKHVEEGGSIEQGRALLLSMVGVALKLKPRAAAMASIAAFGMPLPEWLASHFLEEVSDLARRGLRRAYNQTDDVVPFLRGALDTVSQIRAGPARAHVFHIRHDLFTVDRPENRLIFSTLRHILACTKRSENWRLARELVQLLGDIPPSSNIEADFRRWGHDRLIADYSELRPLCELILTKRSPLAVAGNFPGMSMLFPMERLFEEYVLAAVRRGASKSQSVRAQAGDHHLCQYDGRDWFKLKPDILIEEAGMTVVVDAKWKLLSNDRSRNFDLSSADFYQLHAYGHNYLNGRGDMYLVYPRTERFPKAIGPFAMSDTLNLHVIPFNLQAPDEFHIPLLCSNFAHSASREESHRS